VRHIPVSWSASWSVSVVGYTRLVRSLFCLACKARGSAGSEPCPAERAAVMAVLELTSAGSDIATCRRGWSSDHRPTERLTEWLTDGRTVVSSRSRWTWRRPVGDVFHWSVNGQSLVSRVWFGNSSWTVIPGSAYRSRGTFHPVCRSLCSEPRLISVASFWLNSQHCAIKPVSFCGFTLATLCGEFWTISGKRYICGYLGCSNRRRGWLVTRVKVIHNCEQSQVPKQMSLIKIFRFSKRLKEVKHEMLEVMNCGKLFQTAGATWQNALSVNATAGSKVAWRGIKPVQVKHTARFLCC